MIGLRVLFAAIAVTGFMQIPYTAANADPSTGHVRNYKPTEKWLSENSPLHITHDIQASECGMNTRLHYPEVQLFAWFKYNHDQDNYHGCPYGDCLAFKTAPQPEELELDFLNHIVFFWHDIGGSPGSGVKPISNPRTGALGYEKSLSGQYLDGPTPAGVIQGQHDSHYPGFNPDQLPFWPKDAANRFIWAPEPEHPKCGRPCEPNKDPGIKPGAYGFSKWAPASADKYPPPPGSNLQCSTNPDTGKCESFCKCTAQCQGHLSCTANCSRINGAGCDVNQCHSATGSSSMGPQPGQGSGKCSSYCNCSRKCSATQNPDSCIESQCASFSEGCQDECQAAPPSNPDSPGYASHTPKNHHKKSHASRAHKGDGPGRSKCRRKSTE